MNHDLTVLQKQMVDAVGYEVDVFVFGMEKPLVGKCCYFTPPLDNEPEIAAIDIEIPGKSGLTEITEEKIEKIIIKRKTESGE